MEVQMSRERAELARQRSELQRLQSEIRHELDLAARDAALRERLAPLQRRHQEMTGRTGAPAASDTSENRLLPRMGSQSPKTAAVPASVRLGLADKLATQVASAV